MSDVLSAPELMIIAIEEQNKCISFPKIGVVIAKDGKVLSRAYRSEVEGKHAERIAIEKLEQSELIGSTIVTTLEPCVEMHDAQPEKCCAELISNLGVKEVVIGVLDPNGKIYCQGYETLLKSSVKVGFFDAHYREIVESNTFKYGDCSKGYGPSGKRRVAVVGSGKNFSIQFSKKDERTINFKWQTLQFIHGIVDLICQNDSIRCAMGARYFDDISDPLVFRETSHFARMKKGDIAIISPTNGTFIILVKLLDLTESDIFFQWQVRDK